MMKHEQRMTKMIKLDLKLSMLRSSLCDYSDAYILVKCTTAVAKTSAQDAASNAANKKVIFKNCAPFINCISKINNTQVDDTLDVVMPMYNVLEYKDNYSKRSEILWQYCRDKPALDDNNATVNFNAAIDTTKPFNLKAKTAAQVGNNDTKDVEIMVPLKYLSTFR